MSFQIGKEYCYDSTNLGKFKKTESYYTNEGPVTQYNFEEKSVFNFEEDKLKKIQECNSDTELKNEENDMILDCDVTENNNNNNNKMKLKCKYQKTGGGQNANRAEKITTKRKQDEPAENQFVAIVVVKELFYYKKIK